MVGTIPNQFIVGLAIAATLGAVIRVLVGMRLNLYLISDDTLIRDQAMIPISSDLKRARSLLSLFRGKWRENIEISLTDYQNRTFTYQIEYGLWRRFQIALLPGTRGTTLLAGREMAPGKRYALRTGMKLRIGDRPYTVLVTLASNRHQSFQDLLPPLV
jgi:hypothetical protein